MFEEFYNYKCPRGEHLPYEFLYHEYIELNLGMKEISRKYNIPKGRISKDIHYYNIEKSSEMIWEQTRKTCIERFGAPNPFACKEIQEKVNKTLESKYGENPQKQLSKLAIEAFKDKYGVDNPMQLEQCKQKFQETCIEKYGVDHPMKIQEIKDKVKETFNEKYGGNAPMCSKEVRNKYKQTSLDRYGETSFNKTEEGKLGIKQALIDKYGTDNIWDVPGILEKYKNTCLDRYGVEYASQGETFKENVKKTCLEKYGVEYAFQAEEVKQKSVETSLKKYGTKSPTQSPEVQQKIYEGMKKNGGLTKSEPEIIIEDLLRDKFTNIETQYNKDPRYPFLCDFYVPELDLFIEYQGYQAHGDHPFNPNNEEDLNLVKFWKEKSKEINFKGEPKNQYKSFINTWTKKDPLKRKVAKDNNLNWIEFFSLEEFMDWYSLY